MSTVYETFDDSKSLLKVTISDRNKVTYEGSEGYLRFESFNENNCCIYIDYQNNKIKKQNDELLLITPINDFLLKNFNVRVSNNEILFGIESGTKIIVTASSSSLYKILSNRKKDLLVFENDEKSKQLQKLLDEFLGLWESLIE